MQIEMREFDERDVGLASEFASVGMNFDRLVANPVLRGVYSRFFVEMELAEATQAIAAYADGRLAGLLMAHMAGEARRYRTVSRMARVRVMGAGVRLFDAASERAYERANRNMLARCRARRHLDGEISFLAADPAIKGQGIGRRLLDELARREAGKTVFLYTDDNCDYGFYEHMGFTLEEQAVIAVGPCDEDGVMRCMLYSRELAGL